jgi:hypothetical protein
VGTTYSSSAECGRAAGIKTVGANSYPTETMIDEYRDDAYALIGEVIGVGTTDSGGVAKAIEKAMVARKIFAVINKQVFQVDLLPAERTRLCNHFESWGMGKWEPDKDSSLSGT